MHMFDSVHTALFVAPFNCANSLSRAGFEANKPHFQLSYGGTVGAKLQDFAHMSLAFAGDNFGWSYHARQT